MKKIDDHLVETALRSRDKDILVYLYEKHYKYTKAFVLKHGGSESDVDGVLKDALVLLWRNYDQTHEGKKGHFNELISQFINDAWQKGEAKRYISRNTRIKHYYLRMYNRKTAGILVLLFILVSVPFTWMYLESFISTPSVISARFDSPQSETLHKKEDTDFSFNNKSSREDQINKAQDDTIVYSDSMVNAAEKIQNTDNSYDENLMANESTEDERTENENTENIVIKKDKMVFSKIITVIEKSKESNVNNATKELVEKLNPEAHLPEETKLSKSYIVEFWKSPLNYKGYKLGRNKVILFGIDNFDFVKLYNIDEHLYIELGTEYFQLELFQDFKPLNKLRDPAILAQIHKS